MWFGLVAFYGISTIVGYLMPNPLYTYIYYMICKQNLLNMSKLIFSTQLNDFKYCYQIRIILLTINNLLAQN